MGGNWREGNGLPPLWNLKYATG